MADVSKIKLPDSSEYNIKDYRIPGVDTTPTSGSDNVVTSGGVYDKINDESLVISTALNDLNNRLLDVEENTSEIDETPTEDSTNLVTSGGVYAAIIENEIATASALNDLNERINDVDDIIGDGSDFVWEPGTGTNSVIVKNSLGAAGGNNSTVEGKGCVTGGNYTENTLVTDSVDQSSGSYGHAEGRYTISCGVAGSHAEGNKTLASGNASHAEGQLTVASGARSHAEGLSALSPGINSHAEGRDTIANGTCSHAEGRGAKTNANYSHAEGICTIAEGEGAHAEGMTTRSIGINSHSECGNWWHNVLITGDANATQYEIVEEEDTDAQLHELYNSVGSEMFTNLLLKSRLAITGSIPQTATPIISVTSVSLVNNIIHASVTVEKTLSDTVMTNASGGRLNMTMAYGNNSHSEASIAWGANTHAEGFLSTAIGQCSHSEGRRTITNNSFEHAEGSYNVSNKASSTYGNAGNTQHSIGIGNSTTRKNAVEVMQNGDLYVTGVGSYDGTNYSSASTVQDVINGKQNALTSGTDIKTINNESLLGSGNITITGSGTIGNLITDNTTTQTPSASESFTGDIYLHKIAKTGTYSDLIDAPDIGNAKIFYGTCSTAAATKTKEVTCPGFTAEDLVKGALIFVTFDYTNSGAVASLYMNVNSTGAKRLKKVRNAAAPADLSHVAELQANVTYLFGYNGTQWVLLTSDYNTNTTYTAMTSSEANTGTATTARTITAAILKSAITYRMQQLQADWEQETNTSATYIKNKPIDIIKFDDTVYADWVGNTLTSLTEGTYTKIAADLTAGVIPTLVLYSVADSCFVTFSFLEDDRTNNSVKFSTPINNLGVAKTITVNNDDTVTCSSYTIQGGSSGSGEANVIEAITFNGTPATITNKTAAITATIPVIESLTTSEIDTIWNSAT